MKRIRVLCFDVQSSKVGSPHLCQLRTASVGSHKLSSFHSHQVGHDTLPHFTDVQWDSVWATYECPSRVSHGRKH
jgi:hypothetical protein